MGFVLKIKFSCWLFPISIDKTKPHNHSYKLFYPKNIYINSLIHVHLHRCSHTRYCMHTCMHGRMCGQLHAYLGAMDVCMYRWSLHAWLHVHTWSEWKLFSKCGNAESGKLLILILFLHAAIYASQLLPICIDTKKISPTNWQQISSIESTWNGFLWKWKSYHGAWQICLLASTNF